MSMTLFELDLALQMFEPEVDEETGEVLNIDEWEQINLARDAKIEGIALKVKNQTAFIKALEDEKKALEARLDSAKASRDRLKDFLAGRLNGEKFETTRCKIGWRKTSAVDVFDLEHFKEWATEKHPDLLRVTVKTEPDKTAISEAIKAGIDVTGAKIVERKYMSIK